MFFLIGYFKKKTNSFSININSNLSPTISPSNSDSDELSIGPPATVHFSAKPLNKVNVQRALQWQQPSILPNAKKKGPRAQTGRKPQLQLPQQPIHPQGTASVQIPIEQKATIESRRQLFRAEKSNCRPRKANNGLYERK